MLIVSLKSAYFHLDKSCFFSKLLCRSATTVSDLRSSVDEGVEDEDDEGDLTSPLVSVAKRNANS